jgi:hypothetical protein
MASANTLTGLIPTIYTARDIVSRELIGAIPAVTTNASESSAAKDQVIRVPIVPTVTASDIAAGATASDAGGQSVAYTDMTISKSRKTEIMWTGEEQTSINANGDQYNPILANQFAQAFRTLANEVEADLCGLHTTFSRAYGTATTAPFASAFTDSAQISKILDDNGAPGGDRSCVLNTTAAANLSTLLKGNFTNGGTTAALSGELLNLDNISFRKSAQIKRPAAGDMASASTVSGALTVGQTTLTLKNATGTGTVSAGDIITIANDTNKYVVAAASFAGANPATGDTITLAAPGIRMAQGAAERILTVVAVSSRNMAFVKSALILLARSPIMPVGGDCADDVMIVSDPVSGLPFQVALYRQYRQAKMEVGLAWGVKNIKPAHTVILLGD